MEKHQIFFILFIISIFLVIGIINYSYKYTHNKEVDTCMNTKHIIQIYDEQYKNCCYNKVIEMSGEYVEVQRCLSIKGEKYGDKTAS